MIQLFVLRKAPAGPRERTSKKDSLSPDSGSEKARSTVDKLKGVYPFPQQARTYLIYTKLLYKWAPQLINHYKTINMGRGASEGSFSELQSQ